VGKEATGVRTHWRDYLLPLIPKLFPFLLPNESNTHLVPGSPPYHAEVNRRVQHLVGNLQNAEGADPMVIYPMNDKASGLELLRFMANDANRGNSI